MGEINSYFPIIKRDDVQWKVLKQSQDLCEWIQMQNVLVIDFVLLFVNVPVVVLFYLIN